MATKLTGVFKVFECIGFHYHFNRCPLPNTFVGFPFLVQFKSRQIFLIPTTVLSGFPRLYIFELYPVYLAPVLRYFGYKLWTVVHAYVLRFPVPVYQVLQHPDDPAAF